MKIFVFNKATDEVKECGSLAEAEEWILGEQEVCETPMEEIENDFVVIEGHRLAITSNISVRIHNWTGPIKPRK
jgi:hypothetical protein